MKLLKNFLTTVRNSDQALALGKDFGEVAIDYGVADSALKEVPILSTIINMYKMGNNVAAYFFAKNLMAFLAEVDKVSTEKRIEFLDERCLDDEGIESVGEMALMILDKIDHPKLATMLGRAFALMVNGTLTNYQFEMYAHIIKNLNSYLIYQLKQAYRVKGMTGVDGPAGGLLANYGLVEIGARLATGPSPYAYCQGVFGQNFYDRIIIGQSTY